MLTGLQIRNFKGLKNVDIELGESVVFIGPNNAGKTTALQALALWDVGLRQWNAKRTGKASPEKRPGVTINRRDLVSVPVPAANLLWHDLHTRNTQPVKVATTEGAKTEGTKTKTENIRIDITVSGVTGETAWDCGIEFDYSNEESFICRPLRLRGYEAKPVKEAKFSEIPREAAEVKIAYLPPMSGLADREFLKQEGELDFLIGQGQTAQVLRNLCYQVCQRNSGIWKEMVDHIDTLFGVQLGPPRFIAERGEIVMDYEHRNARLDLSSSGRGLQQTLLLLARLYANPGTVLLLDEPDAHLEILRQRQTYQLITEIASAQRSQIIAASHSEVVLNEASDRDIVIAFVGKPHRIDDRGSQVAKALKEIGFEQYYQAEQNGWVLYLEGSTDLSILQSLARKLNHPVLRHLERPFLHAVGNQPKQAHKHFFGLREAKKDLVGVAVFDRQDKPLPDDMTDLKSLAVTIWARREIENYLCTPDVLKAYVRDASGGGLFAASWEEKIMGIVQDLVPPVALRDSANAWWSNTKITDDFLDPLFERFFRELHLPNLMRKTDYHTLAKYVPADAVPLEVVEKLDVILQVAERARPRED
jgi:ABC-type lipoprotein export system ATPase subunit